MSIERRRSFGPRATAVVRFTERRDGDLAVDAEPGGLAERRRAVAPGPWTWLRQMHGSRVIVVDRPGAGAGEQADAAVTATPGAVLAVQTADCAPVVLAGDGVVGVAHAGWRGVEAGVVANTVEAMHGLGATDVRAWIGPCIEAPNYEFGADLLDRLVATLGPTIRGVTRSGRPALDLTSAVRIQLSAAGVDQVERLGGCTADQPERLYSHRARGESGRQAGVVWIEAMPPTPRP